MERRLIAGQCALVLAVACPSFAVAAPPSLTVEKISTTKVQVVAPNGDRGAALAQLRDGRLLLGGGENGSNLYLYDRKSESFSTLGRVIKSSERINDSRFAITDIAILNESGNSLSLLISFPEYNRTNSCVTLVLYRYSLALSAKPQLTRGKQWFRSSPCVPVSAVQHAAGRIEVIDSKSAYLTTGDLGFPKINNRSARGTLGSIYKVSGNGSTRISQGHRNPQGVLLIGSDLYISEHGPRGGDELNLVEQGKDYGWPFVTYGEPYGSGDYVRPSATGAHDGFTKPLFYWVPSVAPTELIQLPQNSAWGKWAGQIVMGTLRENALIFIELTSTKVVGEVSNVNVSERIRDLEVDSEGTIIASTDSGELLFISPS
ncbi:MAG: PQQ-dependent sugar dehydrogenase [Actinobacteria bacterium]|nr:PQQ-dependent sugar dehydrogenase [Actinomycetota bacterium]